MIMVTPFMLLACNHVLSTPLKGKCHEGIYDHHIQFSLATFLDVCGNVGML